MLKRDYKQNGLQVILNPMNLTPYTMDLYPTLKVSIIPRSPSKYKKTHSIHLTPPMLRLLSPKFFALFCIGKVSHQQCEG